MEHSLTQFTIQMYGFQHLQKVIGFQTNELLLKYIYTYMLMVCKQIETVYV